MRNTLKSIPLLMVLVGYLGFAQNKPYPQAVTHSGSIKPTNVTQATMNDQVYNYYVYWKGKYLKNNLASLPGGYYVLGDITGSPDGYNALGSSEGQGYGMIITVLMAGKDANAKTYYDGLFKTARAFKSSANSNLMGWVVADAASAQGHFGSASDGDLDIAYSLILAHYQWGSTGAINYLEEAKKMITNGIKASTVTNGNRINLGDWQSKTTNDSRPSDWMISHFRAFKAVTGDATWDNVASTTYGMVNTIQSSYSPNTGLLPDFVTNNPVRPAGPNFLESENDGNYYYNACRTPLRVLMDWGHNGDAQAKTAANKMVTWAKSTTGGTPANFKAGYTLTGGNLSGNGYSSAVFVAPMVAAATCDASHQAYLNTGWSTIVAMKEGYFEDSYNMLCMLYISGNWWKPSGTTPPPNVAPTATLTSPSNGNTFTAPAAITVSANAADSDGSVTLVEFYNNGTKIGEDNSAPYSISWTNVAAGSYSITAKATDNLSATGTSAAASITVTNPGNTPPTITLTAPTTGSSYAAPATITITATAADADGSVAKVQFYNGTQLLNEDATAPYSYTWSGVAAGTYSISAKAVDNANATSTSSVSSITVTTPATQSPYGGTPISIPGKVEAENYDLGGSGIAFNDLSTSNEGGQYRNEAVDIEACTDAGTGYNVGYIKNGEWLEYTVNVTAAGNYNFQARVAATTAGKSFNITLDGAAVGSFTVPNTTGWQIWQTVTVSNVALTAGQKILRINATADDFNVNYINVVAASGNQNPTVNLTTPTAGSTFTAPATINIAANATDDVSIARVEFYNGTTKLGEDATAPYTFAWANVAVGTYSITAKAFDNATGSATSAAVSVTVNSASNANPTASLTAPTNGSSFNAPATINIAANASDDVSIAKVEFYNGTTKLGEDASTPYTFTWTNVAAGTYSITAKAFDNVGATGTSTAVSVTVKTVVTNNCTGVATYTENSGYVAGSVVQNAGARYQCKPYPYSGWCNGAAWAYAPGTGAYWTDAWTSLGTCSSARTADVNETESANDAMITNAPNPFNGITNVNVVVKESGFISVKIFDLSGTEVAVVTEGYMNAGTYNIEYNATSLKSNVYLMKYISESGTAIRKIVKTE